MAVDVLGGCDAGLLLGCNQALASALRHGHCHDAAFPAALSAAPQAGALSRFLDGTIFFVVFIVLLITLVNVWVKLVPSSSYSFLQFPSSS